MPANKKAAAQPDEPKARKAKADAQGHPAGGPDYVPSADEYDPAKHANHSHLEP